MRYHLATTVVLRIPICLNVDRSRVLLRAILSLDHIVPINQLPHAKCFIGKRWSDSFTNRGGVRASNRTFLCGCWEGSFSKARPEVVDRFVIRLFVSLRTVGGSVKALFGIVSFNQQNLGT
jgi:hypothetical protein